MLKSVREFHAAKDAELRDMEARDEVDTWFVSALESLPSVSSGGDYYAGQPTREMAASLLALYCIMNRSREGRQ